MCLSVRPLRHASALLRCMPHINITLRSGGAAARRRQVHTNQCTTHTRNVRAVHFRRVCVPDRILLYIRYI